MAKKASKSMSPEHKEALAAGRAEGRAVRAYLEALESSHSRRGRRRSPELIEARLAEIEELIPDAEPVARLGLVQERSNLRAQLEVAGSEVEFASVEAAFVEHARSYGERKGIDYSSWREVGVPASVLRAAGINRSGR
jgi:hypothetical protein